jgi:hypothetical protein
MFTRILSNFCEHLFHFLVGSVTFTEEGPNLFVYRARTVPYRTVPYRTVSYRTVTYRTLPYPTVPFSASDRFGRPHSVPYFFDRLNAIFLYEHEPYRTKTRTVFRDFNIKNLNLLESIRKARTVRRSVFILKSDKNRYLCSTLRANNSI